MAADPPCLPSPLSGWKRRATGAEATGAGATGGADTNLDGKMKATIDTLAEKDFVLLHIKGTEVFGHDGDAAGKKEYRGNNVHNTESFYPYNYYGKY